MKIISLVSSHSGTGQTTVAVNLSAGLVQEGAKVLVCNLNSNLKLYQWLGLELQEVNCVLLSPDESLENHIYHSDLGIDVLYLGTHPQARIFESKRVISTLQDLAYDYLILNPGGKKDELLIAAQLADNVIACTDLKHDDESCRLEKLQKEIEIHSDGERGINLILPCKINTNEWETNTNTLFTIGDFFGYERVADLLPYCERIHDLPKDRKTVWQLRQQNIQDAFTRLLERVHDL